MTMQQVRQRLIVTVQMGVLLAVIIAGFLLYRSTLDMKGDDIIAQWYSTHPSDRDVRRLSDALTRDPSLKEDPKALRTVIYGYNI